MVIQWDNRKIPRSWFITVVMAGFWIVWTPVTLLATYCFFLSFGSWAFFFFLVWLVFGYVGVIGIPLKWVLRWSIERIELDDETYVHRYVNLPNWFSHEWPISEIAWIYYGRNNKESMTTLNVQYGNKRDMIAYWALDDFRQTIFDAIQNHVSETEIKVAVSGM